MFKPKRCFAVWLALLGLLITLLCPVVAQAALRQVAQYTLAEYADPAFARTGVIRLYSSDTLPPFANNPSVRNYITPYWAVTDWGSVGGCSGSFLAGGHQQGWVLGPSTNPSDLAVDPSGAAAAAYGVFTGYFGDTGFAYRLSCTNAQIPETSSLLAVFLFSRSYFVQGQGYWIGNVLYQSDYYPSGNWYYLYSPTP